MCSRPPHGRILPPTRDGLRKDASCAPARIGGPRYSVINASLPRRGWFFRGYNIKRPRRAFARHNEKAAAPSPRSEAEIARLGSRPKTPAPIDPESSAARPPIARVREQKPDARSDKVRLVGAGQGLRTTPRHGRAGSWDPDALPLWVCWRERS